VTSRLSRNAPRRPYDADGMPDRPGTLPPDTTRRTLVVMVVLAVALATAAPMLAAEGPGSGRSIDDEILIRYAPGTTALERDRTLREAGLTHVRTTADGRTQVVTAPGRATATVRRDLAGDPNVVAIAPNRRRELADDIAGEPAFGELWGLHNTGQALSGTSTETARSDVDIDALQALSLGLGSPSVVVAVIDDGVDFSHPDLAQRPWTNPGESGSRATNGIDDDGNGYVDDAHGWDFCNGDATVHDAGEDGHGTHVAGTLAASLDGTGVVGVAPGISIMALKFIGQDGACGTDDLAVEAIDYAASFGVRIINGSWGGPQASTVLDAAIAASGALFVAAAGNGGSNLDLSPGPRFYPASSVLPNVVAVAAVDQAGRLAGFSNHGAVTVDLAGPGTNILSAYPASAGCPSPCYAWAAGTSMAAPHVSGVAALVGSAQPALLANPIGLRARLLATGRILDATVGKTATGRLVNALRAIDTGRPAVGAPDRFRFKVGSIVGSSAVPTVVAWPVAVDPMSGVASYQLRRQGPEGWSLIGASLTGTSVGSSLRYGSDYRFRLGATDQAGNAGGPVDSPVVRVTLHPDASSLATYGPGWSTVASAGATGHRLHTASRRGSWMSFSFTGRSVALVSPKGTSRGSVKVYVDGAYVSTVDLHRSSAISKVIVFSRSWSTKARHTVRLVVLGTSGHPRVDVDGFIVVR